MNRLLRALAAGVASLSAAVAAQAQGVNDGALAEALFRDGKALFASGDYDKACPKFAESQRIDPQPGTLMNLALCHEKQGKTASAWAEYSRAATLAARAGQAQREQVARTSAAALEPTLSRVVLTADPVPAEKVTLDGEVIGAATFGTAFPIDPGEHTVVASAPGFDTYEQKFSIAAGNNDLPVHIPPLAAMAVSPTIPVPVLPPPGGGSALRVAGWTLVGAGASSVVVGSVFGVIAFEKKSSANQQCGASACTAAGLSDVSSMKTAEAVSTVAFGVGLVAAGLGVFFVLRGGHEAAADSAHGSARAALSPLLGPGLAGASLSGVY